MIGKQISRGYSIEAHALHNGAYESVPLGTPGASYTLEEINYYENDDGDHIPDMTDSLIYSHAKARAEAEEYAGKPLTWRPWQPYDYVPEGCAEYAEAERWPDS